MPRSKSASLVKSTASETAAHLCELRPLTEAQAAQSMWVYYRDHKPQLVAHIRAYRAAILSELMARLPVERVFAPFAIPVLAVRPTKRAA